MARGARLAALAALAAVLAGGCDDDDLVASDPTPGPQCGMPFTEYDAGPAVAGIGREARVTDCGRRPFVTYIYGTCKASSDSGCAPPLEVQTWSACHRKRSLLGGAHLGLSRGQTTIVIFARSERLARAAARALRKAKPADRSLPLTRKLRACGAR